MLKTDDLCWNFKTYPKPVIGLLNNCNLVYYIEGAVYKRMIIK